MVLANKNALITGGSNGIGQAIAIAFAQAGANVAFTYNNHLECAKKTLNLIGDYTVKKAIQANLSNLEIIPGLLKEVEDYLGCVDVLVNNAGVVSRFPDFLSISPKKLEESLTVNLKAPFILMQEVAMHMKNKGISGSVINISSISAEITSPGLAHYEASKAGLNALTRGAANDLARFNIRVNTIAPGLVETNMNKAQREQQPELWSFRSSKIPLGRPGQPDDIASLAIFLASGQASWITGAVIPVDGGMSIGSPFNG